MNKLIKELAEEATHPRGPNKPAEFDRDYFARLIINECLSMARSYSSQNDDYAAGIDSVRDSIKEHFGVVR